MDKPSFRHLTVASRQFQHRDPKVLWAFQQNQPAKNGKGDRIAHQMRPTLMGKSGQKNAWNSGNRSGDDW